MKSSNLVVLALPSLVSIFILNGCSKADENKVGPLTGITPYQRARSCSRAGQLSGAWKRQSKSVDVKPGETREEFWNVCDGQIEVLYVITNENWRTMSGELRFAGGYNLLRYQDLGNQWIIQYGQGPANLQLEKTITGFELGVGGNTEPIAAFTPSNSEAFEDNLEKVKASDVKMRLTYKDQFDLAARPRYLSPPAQYTTGTCGFIEGKIVLSMDQMKKVDGVDGKVHWETDKTGVNFSIQYSADTALPQETTELSAMTVNFMKEQQPLHGSPMDLKSCQGSSVRAGDSIKVEMHCEEQDLHFIAQCIPSLISSER